MKKNILFLCAFALLAGFTSCKDSNSSSGDIISKNSETEEITTADSTVAATTTKTTESITTTIEATSEVTTAEATEPTTAAVTEPVTEIVSVKNTAEYVAAIGERIEITDIIKMDASLIGAIDGTSFKYNGNKFEIYEFDENSDVLSEAHDGNITLNMAGFGEVTAESLVNGNFVMIYSVSDDNVSQAFMAETF